MANQTSSGNALKEAIQARRASLEAELKAFDNSNIDKLFAERDQLGARLGEIEAKIAELARHVGAVKAAPKAATPSRKGPKPGGRKKRRTRIGSQEIRDRILKALGEEKSGLSQKSIAEGTSIPYGTVAAFLKANAAQFKSTGKLKSKRYFLK